VIGPPLMLFFEEELEVGEEEPELLPPVSVWPERE